MSVPFLYEQVAARPFQAIELEKPLELAALPTPALVLEQRALRNNIERMATRMLAAGKGFRPHTKTHKCPLIAQLQLTQGAVGVCVAKVSEAATMVAAGVAPILITSPLASADKVALLNQLLQQDGQLAVVVDSELGANLLVEHIASDAALDVVIDLDVAMGRTGMRDETQIQRVYELISNAPHLNFIGFQHYAGHVMHVQGHAERARASLALWEEIEARLQRLDLPAEIVTGGGTGTYDIDIAVAALTDLQVGSYVFMDEEYRQIGSSDSDRFEDFEVSLTIACRAISQPMQNAITLDGGYKAMASDTVPPVTDELANTKFRFAGDEHGVLLSKTGLQGVQLGDVVRLVTPHCDPTVNLHDYYWVLEDDGMIHSCWPISGRGCTW